MKLFRLPFSLHLALLFLAGAAQVVVAEVRLPALFGDGMVLQRRAEVPVWGWAEPGEAVRVSIDDQQHAAIADERGQWSVTLQPLQTGDLRTLIVEGRNRIQVDDILVGEVWLCAGQSNMGYSMAKARANGANGTENDDAFDLPEIRLFRVPMQTSHTPQTDVAGTWERCDAQSVAEFSAVGFYLGRELHQRLQVPVGLIHACWWGTPIQPWIPLAAFESDVAFAPLAAKARKDGEAFAAKQAQFEAARAVWLAQAESERGAAPEAPKAPYRWLPTVIDNGLIHPLGRSALAGVAWYQGEGNVSRPDEYRALLSLLINGWRGRFRRDLPFIIVQLHGYADPKAEPGRSRWAELREAQSQVRALPNTVMTVAIDLGAPQGYEDPMHPPDKRTVGKRLALTALRDVYGNASVLGFPEFVSLKPVDGTIHLSFRNADGGLRTKDGQPPRDFVVAGADGIFVPAQARIAGETILVSAGTVPHPVAVRYAWVDAPYCNVYNASALPLAPFRTDDWGLTHASQSKNGK